MSPNSIVKIPQHIKFYVNLKDHSGPYKDKNYGSGTGHDHTSRGPNPKY